MVPRSAQDDQRQIIMRPGVADEPVHRRHHSRSDTLGGHLRQREKASP
jgi:hypothetical protein